jgi:hypothetical protein
MTVRGLLTAPQALPRDAELLAFEAGCEDYCEREVDEVEWQGGRVYLHLGARRDDPPRRWAAVSLASTRGGRPVALAGLHPAAASIQRPHDPRQATGSGQCDGPASPWWAIMRKQRPGSGEKASA